MLLWNLQILSHMFTQKVSRVHLISVFVCAENKKYAFFENMFILDV